MMVKTLVSLLLVAGWNAHAGISRTAITTVQFSIHGLYSTSDPTCRTGLVATIPITATPTAQNFVGSPTLGTGPIPTEIKCVVMLVKNRMVTTWSAGTYTTSTLGNPDSDCNGGATTSR